MLAALRREIISAEYTQERSREGGTAKTTQPMPQSARQAA